MRNASKRLMGLVGILVVVLAMGAAAAHATPVTNGLTVWLKADAITGMSNGDLFGSGDTWVDSSVNGYDASWATGAPGYYTAGPNGKPYVSFAGGGGLEYTNAIGLSGNADYTIFIVASRTGNFGSNTQRGFQFGDIDDGTSNASIACDLTTEASGGSGFRFNGGYRVFNESFQENTYHIGAWQMPTAGTYGTAEYWRDGTAGTQKEVGNPGSSSNLSDDGYTVGRGAVGGGYQYVNADIAEIILYDRVLTATDMNEVGYYLEVKYGLDTLYTPEPATIGLLGIGSLLALLRRRSR